MKASHAMRRAQGVRLFVLAALGSYRLCFRCRTIMNHAYKHEYPIWHHVSDRIPTREVCSQVDVIMWSPEWATWLKGNFTFWSEDEQEWSIYNQFTDRYEVMGPPFPLYWCEPIPPGQTGKSHDVSHGKPLDRVVEDLRMAMSEVRDAVEDAYDLNMERSRILQAVERGLSDPCGTPGTATGTDRGPQATTG